MARGLLFGFFLILASCGERVIDFTTAQRVATERFNAYSEDIPHGTFMPVRIRDRDVDWHFEWKRRDGSGSLIVIVLRNGEFSDGINYPAPIYEKERKLKNNEQIELPH